MGRAVHAGAALVASDIHATGAVRIETVAVEDTCASADAVRAAEALVVAKFDAVIGFPCRATAQAAALVFARAGRILIATAPIAPPFGLTQAGPTVFRLPVAATSQGQFIGQYLAKKPAAPETRIAIVRDKTHQAIGLAQAVDAGVRAAGRTVATVEMFTGGDKAFGPLVARLKALGITHVALLAYPVEAGLIAAELVTVRPGIEIVLPDFAATDETPLIAGAAASRLRVVLPSGDPLGAAEAGQQLLARLKSHGMIAGGAETLTVASALEAYGDAVRRAGSGEPAAVAAALREAPGPLRYGATPFDARGHRAVRYWAVYRWGDDRRLMEER